MTFRTAALYCLLTFARSAAPAAAQSPPIVQPGAPGQPSREIDADRAADLSHVQATPADVKFMQGMISHHAQAIDMVNLLYARTDREDMRLLAKRIELSQADEIKMMQHWLQVRGQQVPDPRAPHMMHDMNAGPERAGSTGTGKAGAGPERAGSMGTEKLMHDTGLMPGMLTQAEMDQLAAAKGDAFDRLFLEGMIKHHGGALTMVHDLFATPGAGQDSEIFAFASDVDADQRMEIDRMSAMLKELQK